MCYPVASSAMANILIWGKAREVLAGELPPGITAQEVDSLASLQNALEGKGSTLILADAAHLESEKAALETWVRSGANRRALLVCVAEPAEADDLVRRFAFLDDVLTKPLTATRLRLRLDRALDTINSRRVIEQLDEALARKSQELHELNKIGVALSAERDIDKLLELILAQEPGDHRRRRGQPLPRGARQGAGGRRGRLPALQARAERLGGASRSKSSRCRSASSRSRATPRSRGSS